MRALMSLCNVGLYNSQFSLISVDVRGPKVDLVDCTSFINPAKDAGVNGLLRLPDGGLAVTVQSNPPRVVFLDAELKHRKTVTHPSFVDLHSLTLHDGYVFVTCTGVNRIVKIDLASWQVSPFWEYPIDRPFLHVNALAFLGGRPVVLSHKLPRECDGGEAKAGCWRLDDFEVLVPRMHNPHTLMVEDDTVHCLSSGDGRVISWRAGEVSERHVEGFLRGMARIGGRVMIAASAARFISRKAAGVQRYANLDKIVANPVYMSNLVVADAEFAERRRIDLTAAGFEVFELIEDTGLPEALLRRPAAPVRMQTNQRLIISLREQVEELKDAAKADQA